MLVSNGRAARPGSARPGSARPGSARPGSARPGSARPGSARRKYGAIDVRPNQKPEPKAWLFETRITGLLHLYFHHGRLRIRSPIFWGSCSDPSTRPQLIHTCAWPPFSLVMAILISVLCLDSIASILYNICV